MTRKTTEEIYYEKGFHSAKRCLKEAVACGDPRQYRKCVLVNPRTNAEETVMLPYIAVIWAIENHLPDWCNSTWRMYRAGYRYVLQDLLSQSLISKSKFDDVEAIMSKAVAVKQRVRRTSGKRKKMLSQQDYNKLLDECSLECESPTLKGKIKYKWGGALSVFITSSVATGLRPNEWRTAKLFEQNNKLLLKCENFKHNEERSYATHRTIDLTGISKENQIAIKIHLRIVDLWRSFEELDQHYNGCRDLMTRINKKLWPKRTSHITLYRGRHQFSANAKASESTSDVERAAMMGHKTTRTSCERYGKKRSGSNGLTPEIADKEVLLKIKQPELGRKKRTPSLKVEFPSKTRTPKL